MNGLATEILIILLGVGAAINPTDRSTEALRWFHNARVLNKKAPGLCPRRETGELSSFPS